jgi:hypothetical protein
MDNFGGAGGIRKKARQLFDELSQTYPPVYSENNLIESFHKAREDGTQLGCHISDEVGVQSA